MNLRKCLPLRCCEISSHLIKACESGIMLRVRALKAKVGKERSTTFDRGEGPIESTSYFELPYSRCMVDFSHLLTRAWRRWQQHREEEQQLPWHQHQPEKRMRMHQQNRKHAMRRRHLLKKHRWQRWRQRKRASRTRC